jgi:hypothetical protein
MFSNPSRFEQFVIKLQNAELIHARSDRKKKIYLAKRRESYNSQVLASSTDQEGMVSF